MTSHLISSHEIPTSKKKKKKKKKKSINLVTPASDLALPPCLHTQETKLLHGGSKDLKESILVLGKGFDEGSGKGVAIQSVVGFQDAQTLGKVLEVNVVELVGGDDIVEDG